MYDDNLKQLNCNINTNIGMTYRKMGRKTGLTHFNVHWHDYIEFIYIESGSLIMDFGGQAKPVEAGELVIIPPQQLHGGEQGPDGMEIFSIFIDINALYNNTVSNKTFLQALLDGKVKLPLVTKEKNLIKVVKELMRSGNSRNAIYLQGKAYELLGLALENSTQIPSSTIKLQEIFEYIHSHLFEEIDTRLLCKKFGYSESHFCRLFKAETGISFSLYLQKLRIEESKKMLQETDADIRRISERCGFSDFSYFCRCFKKYVYQTPSDFRKDMKQQGKTT